MKLFSALAIVCLLAFSCNSEPSLQKYFVEKSENKEFLALDLSPAMFNIDKSKLTADEAAAVETFKKINVLAFQVTDSTRDQYSAEKAKVDQILKDEKYQELMHFGSGKDGASVSFVGEDDNIDEFVLYANKKENGFAVIRVLGEDMDPNSIMTMMSVLKNSKMDLEQLKPLQQMFSSQIK
ncbi:MAG TPA: DUF4252 domain-containing protein [Flavobacterium sp.]|jgi:hypothetical protein